MPIVKALAQKTTPLTKTKSFESWNEWNDGLQRAEDAASHRMATYCCGGCCWPKDEVEIQLVIDGEEYDCTVEYEDIDEPYYDSEPYRNVVGVVCVRVNECDCEDADDPLELEYEELSDENKELIDELLEEI